MKKILALSLALVMALSLVACGKTSGSTDAAAFPGNKQINLIVPYAAGGASDTTARIYASELEKALGTTVTVTNITGASGATGLEKVKNATPDGYTIAYMPVESTMLRALGLTNLSTDDFKFIGRAMTIPAAVTVKADSPWNTLEDLLNYAKDHPGEVRIGNSGTGSIWHVAAASIEDKCGVKFTHVPFDGAAPAVTALVGGNIEAVTVSPSEVKSQVDDGNLKVLVVLGEGHSSVVPDVKTAKELGIDITIQGWGGFAVPKDTPQAVIDTLVKASETAINSDAVKELLTSKGFEHAYLNGADMDAKAASELAYYSDLIPSLLS
ncbi:MAG: tripartite tricarboxylate transporter substrate binding protein [Clostridiales bacterium]|nr:tripartite tricarboxylate transporter substrate binding protein [Clostridiales bacterium]